MNFFPPGAVGLLRILHSLAMGIGRVVKLGPRAQQYPLGRFVLAYCAVLVVAAVAFTADPGVGFGAYFIGGYALNRYVLRHLEWNNFEFSLGDVARVKFLAFLTWPVMYPPFLVQLAVTRYL